MVVSKLAVVAAALVVFTASSSASAAIFVADSTSNAPLAGATYTTFNNRTVGSTTQTTGTGITVSFTGNAGFVTGSSPNQYAPPVLSNMNGSAFGGQPDGADATVYVSTGTGTVTLNLSSPTNYFGLLWGSIDAFNSLTLNAVDGTSQTFTGASIIPGLTGFSSNSRYVNFTGSTAISSVVLSSTQNSFEFDNVATGAVPEPATWAMMILGMGAIGFAMRRKNVMTRLSFA